MQPSRSAAAILRQPFTLLLDSIGRSRRSMLVGGVGAAMGAKDDGPCAKPPFANGPPPLVPVAEESSCICQRAHAVVLCHACGWFARCRLMKPCRDHPNTRFLLDLTACPRCRAFAHLMSEYELAEPTRPCTLPMPAWEIGPGGRRSPSPSEAAGGGGGAVARSAEGGSRGSGGGGSGVTAAARARMRPPLQSDGHGMQRKARDSFCSHRMARTPSGLPVSMYYGAGVPPMGYAAGGGGSDGEGCWAPTHSPPLSHLPARGRRRQ